MTNLMNHYRSDRRTALYQLEDSAHRAVELTKLDQLFYSAESLVQVWCRQLSHSVTWVVLWTYRCISISHVSNSLPKLMYYLSCDEDADGLYRLLLSRKLFLCIFSTFGKEVTCFGTSEEIFLTGDYNLLAWVTQSFTMSS